MKGVPLRVATRRASTRSAASSWLLLLGLPFRVHGARRGATFRREGPLMRRRHATRATLDPLFVGIGLRRQMRFMAKIELFRVPLLERPGARMLGAFPVDRGAGDRAALETLAGGARRRRGAADVPRGHAPQGRRDPSVPSRRGDDRRALGRAGYPGGRSRERIASWAKGGRGFPRVRIGIGRRSISAVSRAAAASCTRRRPSACEAAVRELYEQMLRGRGERSARSAHARRSAQPGGAAPRSGRRRRDRRRALRRLLLRRRASAADRRGRDRRPAGARSTRSDRSSTIPAVVTRLAERGVTRCRRTSTRRRTGTVIVRTHGVPPAVIAAARARGLEVVDATCPFVTHRAAQGGDAARRKATSC